MLARSVGIIFAAAAISLACVGGSSRSPSTTPTPIDRVTVTPAADIQRDNDAAMLAVMATIAGREQRPSAEVFTNVKYLADTDARTLLQIMNGGYAKALGVRCSHCHVEGNYASDERQAKRATREMQEMHRMINQQLRGMQSIQTPPTQNRAISCVVCHRGTPRPRG